jgi:hypothetical protein
VGLGAATATAATTLRSGRSPRRRTCRSWLWDFRGRGGQGTAAAPVTTARERAVRGLTEPRVDVRRVAAMPCVNKTIERYFSWTFFRSKNNYRIRGTRSRSPERARHTDSTGSCMAGGSACSWTETKISTISIKVNMIICTLVKRSSTASCTGCTSPAQNLLNNYHCSSILSMYFKFITKVTM